MIYYRPFTLQVPSKTRIVLNTQNTQDCIQHTEYTLVNKHTVELNPGQFLFHGDFKAVFMLVNGSAF
jgi:hypothetical protein